MLHQVFHQRVRNDLEQLLAVLFQEFGEGVCRGDPRPRHVGLSVAERTLQFGRNPSLSSTIECRSVCGWGVGTRNSVALQRHRQVHQPLARSIAAENAERVDDPPGDPCDWPHERVLGDV